MFWVFIICMVGAAVCSSVTSSVAQDSVLTAERKTVAIAAASVGMGLGFFLFQYAEFNIEFYNNLDVDFLDYGKITGEGWLYILMKAGALITVAENVLALVRVFVEEIKQTIKEKHE